MRDRRTRVSCAAQAGHTSNASHGLLIDTRQGVVYERNVVLSKGAAIHTERRGLGDLRTHAPSCGSAFDGRSDPPRPDRLPTWGP